MSSVALAGAEPGTDVSQFFDCLRPGRSGNGARSSPITQRKKRRGKVYVHVHGDHVKDKWGVDNEGTRVRERSKCPQPSVT